MSIRHKKLNKAKCDSFDSSIEISDPKPHPAGKNKKKVNNRPRDRKCRCSGQDCNQCSDSNQCPDCKKCPDCVKVYKCKQIEIPRKKCRRGDCFFN